MLFKLLCHLQEIGDLLFREVCNRYKIMLRDVDEMESQGASKQGGRSGRSKAGLIPKIGGMADAIYQGVHEAVIIDGRVPHSILLELFSDRGSGTRFYRRSHRE